MKQNIRIRLLTLLVIMIMVVLNGCGSTDKPASNPSNVNNPIAKTTLPIHIQLFPSKNGKSTAKIVALASAEDLQLRQLIDHLAFFFSDDNGQSSQMQQLPVIDGAVDGLLEIPPGDYTLQTDFLTKANIRVRHAFTKVSIKSGANNPITIISVMDDFVSVPAKVLNLPGKYTQDQEYVLYIDMGYFGTTCSGKFNAQGEFICTPNFMTAQMKSDATFRIFDDNMKEHKAAITYDLIKAIKESNTNGFVSFDWPAPAQVAVNIIWAEDETGYVKATYSTPMAVPTRGDVQTDLHRFELANLTDENVSVKDISIRIWDANFLSNFSLLNESGIKYACIQESIDPWGGAQIKCTVPYSLPAGVRATFSLKGDVASDYPEFEMMSTEITGATIIYDNGVNAPFLGSTGFAISIEGLK